MTYEDAMIRAKAVIALAGDNVFSDVGKGYIKAWNDLEDFLLAEISSVEIEVIRESATKEKTDYLAAEMLLSMLGD